MMEENEKAKMASVKGNAEQTKPAPEKTLGEVFKEALERMGVKVESAEECNDPDCPVHGAAAKRGMQIGPTVVEGNGDHLEVAVEREGDVFTIVLGKGMQAVTGSDGAKGVQFTSREAFGEFMDFIKKLEQV